MDVRPSSIAGRWYPSQAEALGEIVDGYLRAAFVETAPTAAAETGAVVGLVVPHAGYQYSGQVAATAMAAVLGGEFEVVALLSPSHFHADAPVLTSGHAAYATPLGIVPVARDAAEQLAQALGGGSAQGDGRGHAARPPLRQLQGRAATRGSPLQAIRNDREHAIEIELPFLQRALRPGFQLLPLMVSDQGEAMVSALGQALGRVLHGRHALLVASSDLSHFYPHHQARQLDDEMLRQVETGNPAEVLAAQAARRGQACGSGVIAAVLWAARAVGPLRVRVVARATSGDASGDYERVVGYGAAVIYQN